MHRFLFILTTMADKISWDILFQRVFPWRFTAWEDRNGLKLEKVGPTLIRFLQKSLVSYFHSDLLYHLYYQKISRVNGLFWSFTHVCLPISLRGLSKGVFERLNINRKWAFCLLISLRSKRFQSSYCVKVRAGAKKKSWKGEGRGEVSFSPLPLPRHSFVFLLSSQLSRRTHAETLAMQPIF